MRGLRSDCANAPADLSLRWAYMPFCWFFHEVTQIQWNLDNSKSKGPNSFVWIIETFNNWGLKCKHIFKSGLQNDFELLRILNYWSLNYRGSTELDVYLCVWATSSEIMPESGTSKMRKFRSSCVSAQSHQSFCHIHFWRLCKRTAMTGIRLRIYTTQLAFFINLQRAVIGPSATLTGRWRPAVDLYRMLTGKLTMAIVVRICFEDTFSLGQQQFYLVFQPKTCELDMPKYGHWFFIYLLKFKKKKNK